ncbi:cytochrome c [Roseimaritima ulvae]|uniref:Cytochrome c n=1 Tax=Roseimaritima ulvae TaxID=980254 RepID=A0A5B9QW06_9BACT|nr:cytochrome c [Roseimaritima ulvae]QEG43234.1 Cytochrome c [Roseimaritima ulvae]
MQCSFYLLRPLSLACLLVAAVLLAGCDHPPAPFAANDVERLKWEHQTGVPLDQAQQDVEAALTRLFGTPDKPVVPASLQRLVDAKRIERAAGAVSSTEDGQHFGLFREHCAVCHGLSGNGRGPAAAMQNPYPRDFRLGIVKFKSTPRGKPPTRGDLMRTIVAGEPGTSMPSFAAVPEEDREALVDYVIYLSARGQLQRELFALAANEYDYGEEPLPIDERLFAAEAETERPGLFAEQLQAAEQMLEPIVNSWADAEQSVIDVPEVPPYVGRQAATGDTQAEHSASVTRGQALFHGGIANCVGCHGPAGNGAATTFDFDDWTKDWTTRIGITPDDRAAVKPFRDAGALRPRAARPRNLQLGAFHGGSDPALLYTRIAHGIDGTPMPAVTIVDQPSGVGLTESQVWDLVNYVLSLSPSDVAAMKAEDVVLPASEMTGDAL